MPVVGKITLDCDVLFVHGMDVRMIIVTAVPHIEAAHQLALLGVIGTEDMSTQHRESSQRE